MLSGNDVTRYEEWVMTAIPDLWYAPPESFSAMDTTTQAFDFEPRTDTDSLRGQATCIRHEDVIEINLRPLCLCLSELWPFNSLQGAVRASAP